MLIETTIFRRPVSAGAKGTYDLRIWDNRSKLPVGYAALLSWVVGIPCVTAGMAQTWWIGWVAKRIEGGKGDIGFILGFCACFIVYLPARYVVLSFCIKRDSALTAFDVGFLLTGGPSDATPADKLLLHGRTMLIHRLRPFGASTLSDSPSSSPLDHTSPLPSPPPLMIIL